MSVLEERMRRIARDEFTGMFASPEAAGDEADAAVDPLVELREQLATLTARVDDLEKSAVTRADLEKAALTQAPAGKRTARKTAAAEPSEKTAESTE